MKIPEEIQIKRSFLKESQKAFGERFGVSHATVSGWENGKNEAPYEVIEFVHSCGDVEVMLRKAYRLGQKSVDCMRVIKDGYAKPSHWCEDEPCKHDTNQTSAAEDEVVEKILASQNNKEYAKTK